MENKMKYGIGALVATTIAVYVYKKFRQKKQILDTQEEIQKKELSSKGVEINDSGQLVDSESKNPIVPENFMRDLFIDMVYDEDRFGNDAMIINDSDDKDSIVHVRHVINEGLDYVDLLFTIPNSAYIGPEHRFKNGRNDVINYISDILGTYDKLVGKRTGGLAEEISEKYPGVQTALEGYLMVSYRALDDNEEWVTRSAMVKVEKDLEPYKQIKSDNPDLSDNEVLTNFMKMVKTSEEILTLESDGVKDVRVEDSLFTCRISVPMVTENNLYGIKVKELEDLLFKIYDEFEVDNRRSKFYYNFFKIYPMNYDNIVHLEHEEEDGKKRTVLIKTLFE